MLRPAKPGVARTPGLLVGNRSAVQHPRTSGCCTCPNNLSVLQSFCLPLNSRLHLAKILLKHLGQPFAILLPVPARGIVLQAFDPVAVELVHHAVAAIALEPAIAECAAVVKGWFG